jgi:hypothetical protein
MKRAQEVQSLIEEQRRSAVRSLTLDNPAAAAELRHQCEEGSVPDTVLLRLLNEGYGNRRKGKDEAPRRKSLVYTALDGHPWDKGMRDTTSTTPEMTQIQSFTLGNPVVRCRLLYEFEHGRMRPAVYHWFIEHGPELLKQSEPEIAPCAYVGMHGLPWLYDPMAEQEAAAIARMKARAKKESTGQPGEQAPEGLVAAEEEAEETLEVYRE